MRLTSLPLLVLCLSATLHAQVDQNEVGMWDRTQEYISRAFLSSNAGFLSQKFPWGQIGGLTHLSMIRYVVQDQNYSTQEPFDVGLTGTSSTGLPDYANTKFYATSVALPTYLHTSPHTITHNFNSPITGLLPLPSDGTGFHHCWRLSAAPNWVTDGVSVHMSQAAPYHNTLLCYQNDRHREIPRIEGTQIVEELGWGSVPNGNPAANFKDRAWRIDIAAASATLEGGVDNSIYNCASPNNPNRGYAALDPDFADSGQGTPARFDDYSWIIQAGMSHANGVAVLFHAQALAAYSGGGLALPGITGKFMLDPGDPLFAFVQATVLDGNGRGRIDLGLGPKSSSARRIAAGLPSWVSQALVVKTGPRGILAELTNVFTMRPRRSFGSSQRFRSARLAKTSPLTIALPKGTRTVYVRNDGHGTVLVQQYAGAVLLPARSTVNDRAAMRVGVLPTATKVVLSTSVTMPTPQYPGVSVLYALDY